MLENGSGWQALLLRKMLKLFDDLGGLLIALLEVGAIDFGVLLRHKLALVPENLSGS